MSIPGLSNYQRRHTNGPFDNLPADRRGLALLWLEKFKRRWGKDLPQWRLAILIGQAKRLALHPPSSQWGRSMHGKRGGHAVQRKYWLRGQHPTEKATRIRLLKQEGAKTKKMEDLRAEEAKEAEERVRHKIFPWITPPPAVAKAHEWIIARQRPNLKPPPSPEARALHKQLDPPGCRCYYCAWPDYIEP